MMQMDMPFTSGPLHRSFAMVPEKVAVDDATDLAADSCELATSSRSATAARRLPPSAWSLSAPLDSRLPIPMFRITGDRIDLANDPALRLFGYPAGTDCSLISLELLCPDPSVRRRLGEIISREGQLDGVEADFRHVSGRQLRLEVYASEVSDPDGATAIEGALFDVTAREQAIAELVDTKRRLLSFFDRSPVGYWIEDFSALGAWLAGLRAQGVTDIRDYLAENPDDLRFALDLVRIVDVNPAALALIGVRDKAEVLEGGLGSVVADRELDSFREQIVALWEGQTSLRSVGSVTTLDGEEIEYVLTWVITLDDGPHLGSVVVSVEDVTKVRQTARQLAAVSELKDHFIRSLSHELRTPLTGVVGFTELLKEHLPDSPSPEVADYLEVLAAESVTASDVIDNLVIAAQLAADARWSPNSGRMDMAPVELGAVAREATATLAPRLIESASVDDGAATATGDRSWVALIVRNLLNNAIRHGGADVTVSVADLGETARLVVSDNGGGIPREVVDGAFELFVGKPTHPGLADSLGLGLAVSRALARAMGGDLRYERSGGSSVFILELPSAGPS